MTLSSPPRLAPRAVGLLGVLRLNERARLEDLRGPMADLAVALRGGERAPGGKTVEIA